MGSSICITEIDHTGRVDGSVDRLVRPSASIAFTNTTIQILFVQLYPRDVVEILELRVTEKVPEVSYSQQ